MVRTIVVSALLLMLVAGGIMAEDKQAPQPPQGAPEYQAPPRPGGGVNMALTVEKIEKGLDPDRPLLIWAIGSSFTNGLGDGTALVELVRARFPNMPKVVYRKMAGNSTPYRYALGWARHLVIPDQPDVVLLYNFGKAEDLEKLIVELRKHTTADIIVGTLHWCAPHKPLWGKPDAPNSHQDPPAMRALCAKYGVEFVENRAEMTEYMVANKLSIESLLRDSVHETPYAASMTVKNIARHFHRPGHFGYDPRSRERRVEAEASDAVKTEGDWARNEPGFLVAGRSGGSVSVEFRGNRIDLIGRRSPDGGTAGVLIDGRPADQAPVFYAGYILPNPKNAPAPPNPPRDRAPHMLTLGDHVIPQQWTITMTSDKGDYALVGSVTGPDGDGNAKVRKPSKSGQIIIEPDYWRGAETNRTGDTFTFEVSRCAAGRVDFKGEKSRFRLTLIRDLPNGPHTLKLVAKGDGLVTLDAFDVFQPPLE
jgi:hypothetical protein